MVFHRVLPKAAHSKPKSRFIIVTAMSLGIVLTHIVKRRDFYGDFGLHVVSLRIFNLGLGL